MNFICVALVAACCTVVQTQVTKPEGNVSKATTPVSTLVATPTLSSEVETTDGNVTTETALTTTCEANTTCLVSTVKPNANDTPVEANNTDVTVSKKTQHGIDVTSPGKELCTCNLQLNVCDINCCCDRDCSLDDKLIFRHCESENVYYDTRYCDYMKYIYINNTPFQWHVNQNGMFCVLKSNLPPSYTVHRKRPLTSFEVAKEEKVNKFSWSQTEKRKEVEFNMTEDFVYANNVWMTYGNEIKRFQVPNKYFSNTCNVREDVVNFKNVKTICAQMDISEGNEYLHFRNYFENITIVSNPNFLNISRYKNLQECPKNICVSVAPKICDANFDNCRNVSRNDSRLDLKCSFHIGNNRNDCENAVKALRYNFYHNGTRGYTRMEVLGILEDVSYELDARDFEFLQEFNVNFWWANQTTRNFSAMLSGNPGYLVGKPILSGKLITTNGTGRIERHSDDYLENFLVLPENVQGVCILNRTEHLAIEFGYNLLTRCEFGSTLFNRRKHPNGTEICREFQTRILKMWGITGGNRTVGMFGNADSNVPEDWIGIMYSTSVKELFNKTLGLFDPTNTTLTCLGLVGRMIVDVYHSRVDFKTLPNQEKVLGVTYTFGGFANKTLSYNGQKNGTRLEMDLESRVAFYDISVQKRKKFVDRPSLDVRLPYDFFYPFIKIDNGGEVWTGNYCVRVVLCLVVMFFK